MYKRLANKLSKIGHEFIGVLKFGDEFFVYAFNPKAAGQKPQLEYCRDALDYKLRLQDWRNFGTYVLTKNKDFDDALRDAINSIK
jgi:hypothetical protein